MYFKKKKKDHCLLGLVLEYTRKEKYRKKFYAQFYVCVFFSLLFLFTRLQFCEWVQSKDENWIPVRNKQTYIILKMWIQMGEKINNSFRRHHILHPLAQSI
jgi:hypothetical protein